MVTIEAEPSWHTAGEWFIRRCGAYCGEVMYYTKSRTWRAHPWRVDGRRPSKICNTMDDAISFVLG